MDEERVSTVKREQALTGANLVPAQTLAVRYMGKFFGAWGVGDGGAMEASLPGGTYSIVTLSGELYPFVLEFQGQLVHDF